MRETSAVLAGGAVVHLLSGIAEPLPAESDLDFWIYDPSVTGQESRKSQNYETSRLHSRVFQQFVLERFIKTFASFDVGSCAMVDNGNRRVDAYPSLKGTTMQDYKDFTGEIMTKCGAAIHVHWVFNRATKRTINVIFTNQPIWTIIQGFDLPLCRAALYGTRNSRHLSLQCDPVVRQDLADHKLTNPVAEMMTDRTVRRIAKYCSRYGMMLRSDDLAVASKEAARLSQIVAEATADNPKLKAALIAVIAATVS